MPSAKIWLPLALLCAGALGATLVVWNRPKAEPAAPQIATPLVRAISVEPREVRYAVAASGTVEPRTQSDLVSQVDGEVIWVSPSFAAGGFFEAGEALVRIDPRDHEAVVESSRATVARAESEFARARTERGRQRELAQRSVASQTRIDDAENAYRVAEAQLREARAALERSERDVERTELKAPYAGRVREESVDVGQFVNRGTAVAKLYAVDYAEVRLPVPDRELSFLDIKLGSRAARSPETNGTGPLVRLQADFAGGEQTWQGRIVRTEGEIDPRSRMVNVVARVEDPYGAEPPLAVGLFVSAEILGRSVESAIVLPRTALREDAQGQRVLVIDDEERLRFRPVEVLRTERDRVIIGAGLAPGERVCVSPLGAVVDGMQVRVVEDATADAGDAAG